MPPAPREDSQGRKNHDDSRMEIERTYLLDCLPPIPPQATALRMEQGYFADEPGESPEGRIRRVVHPDGSVRCLHTIKRGSGMVRSEIEREITEEEFERLWPATTGRRLSKTRYLVPSGDLVWEVDAFDELDLVLAEVELPDEHTTVKPPPWLKPHIVRDVTDEKQYRNYQLALVLARRGR